MKTSTEIRSAARIIGEERAVEYVAKAGFDAWDFSLTPMCNYDWGKKIVLPSDHPLAGSDYLKFARKLKQIGLDNGIHCNQSHAPYPTSSKDVCSYFKRSLECTAEAGGKICVIHPDNDKSPEENAEIYNGILDFAKEVGVKIATENMWNWDHEKGHSSFAACATPKSFCDHVDVINDDFFVACLDIGHAEMLGSDTNAPEMVRALGKKRLQALHIHDIDGVDDNHQIPFSMNVDFDAVTKALKEIGYDGYYTLESSSYLKDYTEHNVLQGLKDLAEAASRFEKMSTK